MEPNYEIRKVEIHERPFFILVANYPCIRKIVLYNFIDKQKKEQDPEIGQWIIKYKN